MICQNCGKEFQQNVQGITSNFCHFFCNLAWHCSKSGATISTMVILECEEVAARMCHNMIDVWEFKRAMASRAEKEIERLESVA